MSKFNTKTIEKRKTINHQGGNALKHSPKLELVSLLINGLGSKFYAKESETIDRLGNLIKSIGKKDVEFVAKALIYTRAVVGQRSITHVGASLLSPMLSGNPLGTKFFSKRIRNFNKGGIVYRIDDMLEIAAYYFYSNPGKSMPNAMKKGFKKAIEDATPYELAKYQAKGKSISMIDMFNMVHPKAKTDNQGKTFKQLMDGSLKEFGTHESKNSASGKKVAAAVKSGELSKEDGKKALKQEKSDNWASMIDEGKIGYLALLRNLRNIVKDATDVTFDNAMKLLVNPIFIKKSLVFPHQIDIAMTILLMEMNTFPSGRKTKLITAVGQAYEAAIPNLTELFPHGNTAVVVDTSGSMYSSWNEGCKMGNIKINQMPVEKASLIGATLAKGVGATLYQAATNCLPINFNPIDSTNTIKTTILRQEGRVGHGTYFDSIFEKMLSENIKYDRIFLISDMQNADNILRGSSYQTYCRKYGQPYIYAIDLAGYGTTAFKQNDKLINLFGYGADIYEMIKTAEIDPRAILKEIEAINI